MMELLRNICFMVLTATFPITLLTCCDYALYSVVPDIFTNGMLVPIPKKPGCDTSNPKN